MTDAEVRFRVVKEQLLEHAASGNLRFDRILHDARVAEHGGAGPPQRERDSGTILRS